ncbi:YdcF family protein [bacterium]|nr:YdcF family protein [bacterium]
MKSEIAIVLGGGISAEGVLPFWVKDRLDIAAELYHTSMVSALLLSGKGRDDFPVSEAKAMGDYLFKKEIPSKDILREELSRDTIQNAFFSTVIHLYPLDIKSTIIITNEFHLPRSKMIFDYIIGEEIHLEYQPVSNKNIDKELLDQRMHTEDELIKFYIQLFNSFDKGDLKAVHDFIFNLQNRYHLKYRELENELSGNMVLY